LIRGASPLGLPYTRSRSPLRGSTDAHRALSNVEGRRLAPIAWLARGARSHGVCEIASRLIRGASPLGLPYTRARSPLRGSADAHRALSNVEGRRLAPIAWLARGARSPGVCEIASRL